MIRSYYRCCCINEPVIFSYCAQLKLGHRFHALKITGSFMQQQYLGPYHVGYYFQSLSLKLALRFHACWSWWYCSFKGTVSSRSKRTHSLIILVESEVYYLHEVHHSCTILVHGIVPEVYYMYLHEVHHSCTILVHGIVPEVYYLHEVHHSCTILVNGKPGRIVKFCIRVSAGQLPANIRISADIFFSVLTWLWTYVVSKLQYK